MSGILQILLASYAAASGGTVTQIISFTATGSWTAPTGVTSVNYLVVAGGGAGGAGKGGVTNGGGGGDETRGRQMARRPE